jgi:hypothetical protein
MSAIPAYTWYKQTQPTPWKIQHTGACGLGRFGSCCTAFSHRKAIEPPGPEVVLVLLTDASGTASPDRQWLKPRQVEARPAGSSQAWLSIPLLAFATGDPRSKA